MIRSQYPVPALTTRRITPVSQAETPKDRPSRRDRALVLVATHQDQKTQQKFVPQIRNASAEVVIQLMAGPHRRRGLKAAPSERARYTRAYQDAAQTKTPPPVWERRA